MERGTKKSTNQDKRRWLDLTVIWELYNDVQMFTDMIPHEHIRQFLSRMQFAAVMIPAAAGHKNFHFCIKIVIHDNGNMPKIQEVFVDI